MDMSAMDANEVHTMNAAPLAPAEGLDGRSKTIIEKSKTAHLSTAEVSYLLGQAQHWKNNGGLEGLICTGRPASPPAMGSLYLFDREAVPTYRSDGHAWHNRERHMELKVKGAARVNCYYSMPLDGPGEQAGFQRRRYWLLEERSLVLVHYLTQKKKLSDKERKGAKRAASSSEAGSEDDSAGAGKRACSEEKEEQVQQQEAESARQQGPDEVPLLPGHQQLEEEAGLLQPRQQSTAQPAKPYQLQPAKLEPQQPESPLGSLWSSSCWAPVGPFCGLEEELDLSWALESSATSESTGSGELLSPDELLELTLPADLGLPAELGLPPFFL
ncbi:hypothetical protein N2152v2_004909 [Parachlorella kessleri]